MPIDEACSATSPEGDKQQTGVFQPPMQGARSLPDEIVFTASQASPSFS
jgi:hypothetical protein